VPLYILQNIHWDYGQREIRYNVALWHCRVRIKVIGTLGLELKKSKGKEKTCEGLVNIRIHGRGKEEQENGEAFRHFD